jgi:hypothetical protein
MLKKAALAGAIGAALVHPTLGADTPAYGLNDLRKIVETARSNKPRFDRDYKGKPFEASLLFSAITGPNGVFPRIYTVIFAAPVTVYCRVLAPRDKATIDRITDWDKDQKVTVSGKIEKTLFGTLFLEACEFKDK